MPKPDGLSRRERQIMDILHRLGGAAPAQVRDALPNPPSYTAVNTLLRLLMESGHVRRTQEGQRFVYSPTQPRQAAGKSAMRQVLQTFFGGDLETAVATLLSEAETELTDEEAARLSALIEGAKGSDHEVSAGGSHAHDTEGG